MFSVHSWLWGGGGRISVDKLITVMGPPSHATNMDTESFLDGATMLSDSVQTALMNVSHFIPGINFCTATGHNYVAKRRGAINKTELSTKSCWKQQAVSLASAGLWKKGCQESHGKQSWHGGRAPWALWVGSARRSWENSSCHPCRNGYSLAFTPQVLSGASPSDGITIFIVIMKTVIVMGSLFFSGGLPHHKA